MTSAFVTHADCSRHDTGWRHPDHQGRLAALSRAVYRDMLALHGSLLDVEGRHATEEELRLVHTSEHLERVRAWVEEAGRRGEVLEPVEGLRVSGATWDASTAAVGCALTACDEVLDGSADNAFCAIRPSGQFAGADGPGRFGLLNPVAVAARYLVAVRGVSPVLVVEMGGVEPTATAAILARDPAVDVAGVYGVDRGRGSGPGWFLDRLAAAVEASLARRAPAFLLLSIDFSGLAGDPVGDLGLSMDDFYSAARALRETADRVCEGRLVSILGGGYAPDALGRATVDHLRALTGLPPV